jgi:hypothetical protein
MGSRDQYGVALHEAGHVVVAWALGLKTRKMGVGEDHAAGEAQIEDGPHLLLVDQIAICSAGANAQRILGAPTNDIAALSDMDRIRNLIDGRAEDEGETSDLLVTGDRRNF